MNLVFCVGMILALPADEPAGIRVPLTDAAMFIPAGYKPSDRGVDLFIHLHGNAKTGEAFFTRSGHAGVLITVVRPGLSSAYSKHFSDPKTLTRLLTEATAQIEKLKLSSRPKVGQVVVSSFSAGYGGVREMLKDAETYARIDALVLADTIYAGYVGDVGNSKERRVNPEQMAGFLKYATEAAAGRKRMVLSYCELQPDGYASTAETARYLMEKLGGKAEAPAQAWPVDGMRLKSRWIKGNLEIYGFEGTTGKDHMAHLHGLWALLQRVPPR